MADAAALLESANEFCAARHCGEAVVFWEQASSLRSADPEIHYQLGFCYAAGCGLESVLDPEVAIFHYRRALALAAPGNTAGRAMVLGALGNAYVIASRGGEDLLLNALRCYEEAARIHSQAGQMNDWAREQFNLGNLWCEMPQKTHPHKWQRAVEHYEQALSIRTRWTDTPHYAATLQNLGTAYRQLKSGDPSANIRKAIDCYRRALRASRSRGTRRKLGDLHHNLGNAYLGLAATGEETARNCARAVRHFNRALELRSRNDSTFDYATLQFSRGQALLRLAAQGIHVSSNLEAARACFAEAAEAFLHSGHTELAEQAMKHLKAIPDRAAA